MSKEELEARLSSLGKNSPVEGLSRREIVADLGHGEQALHALERASDRPGPDDGEVLGEF